MKGNLTINKLIPWLAISFLANGFSILFFILFINQNHHIWQLKKQKNEIAQKLNMVQTTAIARMSQFLSPSLVSRQVFMSHLDNKEDCFGIAPPVVNPVPGGLTLIVYLHGLGSNYLEPFIYGNPKPLGFALIEHNPGSLVLSCSYRREGSFGNDAALADISQNIRQVSMQYPIKKIILFGESMGGMTVLNYGATAPSDIQSKLSGIVSIEGTGDLLKLHAETVPGIRIALEKIYGSPQTNQALYVSKSFNYNVHRLPAKVRVAVVSATKDKLVPPDMQIDVIKALKSNNNPCTLITFDSGHGFPPEHLSFQAFDFANQ